MSGFSGQGKIYIGKRLASGDPGPMRWLGNASVFRLGMQEDRVERKESYSGNRLPHRSLTTGRSGEISITFDEFSKANMTWVALGDVQDQAAGVLTDWVVPGGANTYAQGDTIVTPYPGLTVTSIKDSAATPATVNPVRYSVDKDAGTIELTGLMNYTQPFKITGSYEARSVVGAFNQQAAEVFLRFAGINTDDNSRVIVDVYRTKLSPSKQLDLISGDQIADFELTGSMLVDLTRQAGGPGGQFWRMYLPT